MPKKRTLTIDVYKRQENCKIELVNKEKYEPQLNSDSKYYWNVLDDKTQEGYIAKQSVTGVITITEREDPTLVG